MSVYDYCFLAVLVFCLGHVQSTAPPVVYANPSFQMNISVSQLDGRCLEAVNNQPDQIIMNVINTNSCIPAVQVGFTLENGETAQLWKGIFMHSKLDREGYYKSILELTQRRNEIVVFYPINDLFNYDLCLWKEVNEVIGVENTNMYLVHDFARNYQPGYLYEFVWVTDNGCV